MKVSKGFYCSQEKKSYKEGDEYKGKRKDLGDYLEAPKKKAEKKAPANKMKKAPKNKAE